ncbi:MULTISPECIES: SLAP domain-containing protein [unclassified Lactobacillus]|uniref:SLAP domain-containing protein n=1 Tax=unclassified Lactobacillus TaxID=2620435 RepID=UPI000EFB25C3|nr:MULTISPECIES: SLAP domain-containing protein [unclassified Lactobacillus]RMC23742.1 cell surface protein [Lactobacillus sp. ESL0247]RMC27502.1 cell surface protein [Lactobacillus sp. ESL0246]RMC30703.1 cell surface protein [Lactobacillus sp. ESL0245]
MKKNLRIVSATAAALLAVAPAAASTVSTVFADMNVPVVGGTTNVGSTKAELKLKVTNIPSLVAGAAASTAQASLLTPNLPAGASVSVSSAKIYKSSDVDVTGAQGASLKPNASEVSNFNGDDTYRASATVTITGLTAGQGYAITVGGNTYNVTASGSGTIADLRIASDAFKLFNPNLTGAPYMQDSKGNLVNSGAVSLTATGNSVASVVKSITDAYKPAITTAGAKDAADASFTDIDQDVLSGLRTAGVTLKANGTFDQPATAFPVTINLIATNGRPGSFTVTVSPSTDTSDPTYPAITLDGYNGNKAMSVSATIKDLPDSVKFNYVPVNGTVDTKAIQDAFKTTISSTNTTVLVPNVDISKVNTAVAGKYPVVVSATNPDNKTTKVTFMLTVGAKGATYKTVQADTDTVPVYEITGNTVTLSKTTIKNGDQIATFGNPVKIGDKTYIHVNSADSNQYIENKYVDGSVAPAPTVTKQVMHNSYIYDANHKRVGTKTLASYSTVNVYGDATKLADGSLVYKIGDNQYVMADNIDGTSRTLTHNAYVYKTSTKRADKRVLKKGSTVTTYGAPFKFKNGKTYYRIGGPAKQYVRVANF